MERWGIIYSPKVGVLHTHRRWEEVRRLLNERGIEYDFVQSEGHGAEERLAVMLAQNGYRTIIVMGGDGALNRVLNGIAHWNEELLSEIRFGLIPNGYGNDYATYWGLQESRLEEVVDILVKGRTRKVDVGVLQREQEKYFFLNCVNVGLVSEIFNIKYKSYRFWGISGLQYLWSMLQMLFSRIDSEMQYYVNHEHVRRRLMTLCVSNCRGYGQTPNAVPYNGMLDVSAVQAPRVTQLFHGIALLLRGHFLSYRSAEHYRSTYPVEVRDAGGARVSVDGQTLPRLDSPFVISVRRELLHFIIA